MFKVSVWFPCVHPPSSLCLSLILLFLWKEAEKATIWLNSQSFPSEVIKIVGYYV